jgi:hypothetical protein
MFEAIANALNGALNTYASGLTVPIPVAWENTKFDEKVDLYLRPILIPAVTVGAGIGSDAPNRYRGIYQVDVCYRINAGQVAALQIADGIVTTAFPRASRPAITQGQLIIETSSTTAGVVDGSKYIISVNVVYRAMN